MAIERQAVQGLQQVKSTGGPRMAGTSAIQVSEPQIRRSGSSFIDDIFSAAGAFATVGPEIMQQAVTE